MSIKENIMDSAISLWSEPGKDAVSMRSILDRVKVTPPTLYHHFESMYHLYEASHERALARADEWFNSRIDALKAAGPLSSCAYPGLLAELIHQWCNDGRELAFAMYECRLAALRNRELVSVADGWVRLWRHVWQEVADLCGRSEYGSETALFSAGQALPHLIQSYSVADRCCLDEVCRGWSNWLGGRLADDHTWYQHAIRAANYVDEPPARLEGRASEIAQESANMLIELGARKLTYRALAERLSISAPTIQHYYKTMDDVLRGTFSALYWRALGSYAGSAGAVENIRLSAEAAAQLIREGMLLSGDERRKNNIAWIELHLALARTPSLAALAVRFRYRGGHAARRILDPLLPEGMESEVVDRAILANTNIAAATAFLSSDDELEKCQQAERVLSIIAGIGARLS